MRNNCFLSSDSGCSFVIPGYRKQKILGLLLLEDASKHKIKSSSLGKVQIGQLFSYKLICSIDLVWRTELQTNYLYLFCFAQGKY